MTSDRAFPRPPRDPVSRYLLPCLALLAGCAGLPDLPPKPESRQMSHIDSRLTQIVAADIAHHQGRSGFYLLADGLDAFAARVLLASAAERTIDAQYYLFHDDLTGNLLLQRLLAAADRGVRVRLLVDDMDTAGRDADFAALDSHPNFELRLFNPFANRSVRVFEMLTRFGQVTRRMHNKSFTVDGIATVVGGRNIGDEYFAADPEVEFGDLDVLGVGPVAREVSTVFDDYWNHELAYPAASLVRTPPTPAQLDALRERLQRFAAGAADSAYAGRIRSSRLIEQLADRQLPLRWGKAEVFADRPDKLLRDPNLRSTHMGPQLRRRVEGVESELLIFSPYFVPGDAGVNWLAERVRQGVRVRIITNSLASNDVGLVHAGYARYRKALLAAGVELYEAKPQVQRAGNSADAKSHLGSSSRASLHAKTFVFDRQRLFIGSLNLDPRSAVLNTEMGIVFDSPELATAVATWFDDELLRYTYELQLGDNGALRWLDHQPDGDVIYTRDPQTGFFRRLAIWFAGLLPIETQL